ncbi:TonB family protein [Methylobacterium sp. Leaf93]|uniref:energy transducer TonB family protein n=1 Tax=Methylobacterium sp. Leaf93 TaxID=1736249 RepID=UPI0009E860D5|nr:TonB family protein [Methylobacterium sp. Leaf93]
MVEDALFHGRTLIAAAISCAIIGSFAGKSQAEDNEFGPTIQQKYLGTLTRFVYMRHQSSRRMYKSDSDVVVIVKFLVGRDGRVIESDVVKSSGSPDFDRLALFTVKTGSSFPPFPKEVKANSLNVTVPLKYARNVFD